MNQSPDEKPIDENSISVVEDLTPEVAPTRGASRRRELILGLLLLVGVLSWAGWQWWQAVQQEKLGSVYRAAQAEVANHHWEQALALYQQVSGYSDADAQAADVRKTIQRRDDSYKAAKAHALTGEWAAALQAIQRVEDIDPRYRDMKDVKDLSAEALRNVYQNGLFSTLAARTDPQPGLYYRGADAWLRLEGSDARSNLQDSTIPDKLTWYVLYDTPPEAGSAPATPAGDTTAGVVQPALSGRRLTAGAPWIAESRFKTTQLAFDPARYSFFVPAPYGVYAFSTQRKHDSAFPAGVSPYAGYDATYQELDSATPVPVTLPGPDWIIADIDETDGTLLLAESKAQGPSAQGGSSTDPQTALYTAFTDGSEPELVYSYTGTLRSARISPDDKWVLATTYRQLPGGRGGDESIVLISLWSDTPPHVLATKTITGTGPDDSNSLGADFLIKDSNWMLVLVADRAQPNSTFTLFDTISPDKPLAKITVGGAPYRVFRADEPYSQGSVLLVWQPGPSVGSAQSSNVATVAELPITGAARSFTLRGVGGSVLTGAWVRENKLVYSSYSANAQPNQPRVYTVHSLDLSDLGAPEAYGNAIHQATMPAETPLDLPVVSSWFLGSGLMSYVAGGKLHAETYDGSIDVTVEDGVSKIYYLQTTSWVDLR